MTAPVCSFCLEPLDETPLRLWDGRDYCQGCATRKSPDLPSFLAENPVLRHSVPVEAATAGKWLASTAPRTAIVFLVVFSVPTAALGYALGYGIGYWQLTLFWLVFWAVLVALWKVVRSYFVVRRVRKQLPRTVSIADDQVRLVAGDEEERAPLGECKWRVGTSAVDPVCRCLGVQPRALVLVLPDQVVALHLPGGELANWRAFLRLARVERSVRMHRLQLVILGALGLVIGGWIGWVIDGLFRNVEAGAFRGYKFAIFGAIEGVASVLYVASATQEGKLKWFHEWNPLMVGGAYLISALKYFGWQDGRWVVCIFHGVLGVVVGLACQDRRQNARRKADERRRLAARQDE